MQTHTLRETLPGRHMARHTHRLTEEHVRATESHGHVYRHTTIEHI